MKKTTMKDIAKAANVSVATVSYVLNNVSNQTIPDDTKCRIIETANKLNYIPDLAARSLVKQKTGLIGILVNRTENEGFWRRHSNLELIDQLENYFTNKGYHVVLSSLDATNPNINIIAERKLDGVFLIDVKNEQFHRISNQFKAGVPLIVIDSFIDDPLFYKVVYDYEDAITKAVKIHSQDCHFVIEAFNNQETIEKIKVFSGVADNSIHVMEHEQGLVRFLNQHPNKSVIVINELIGAIVSKYVNPSQLVVICTANCPAILPVQTTRIDFGELKSSAAFHLMMQLLSGQRDIPHDKYIRVKAE
ncbi:LacI family DNA-binding transcriptional regulator [Cohnella sp.]|uniref:LacI family DNA-binding transcriptional regulator n=1 Tax=Cohnella sp. TaxID=1883426 RepID=UPI003568CBBD